MIRVRLCITGKVQGVFFRALAVEKAEKIGDLTGFIANEADGSVSVVAEGPQNKINDFIDWCHSGPSTSFVEKIQTETQAYAGEFDEFSIRY